ncbi:hypothetical protein [Pseudalkalibacillus caeni]|uniref:MarR family transcriptional regulator n=1 Tax=Exobacillus caeni TaxID=2574798 RepID=A0A5R9FAI1_9BACL|nr:hypothetical protein [Pseudalkalibacillus caeni]TLS37883.1 hypothetical protein FCL54_08680 [Pseudalkalibacillus caeni]
MINWLALLAGMLAVAAILLFRILFMKNRKRSQIEQHLILWVLFDFTEKQVIGSSKSNIIDGIDTNSMEKLLKFDHMAIQRALKKMEKRGEVYKVGESWHITQKGINVMSRLLSDYRTMQMNLLTKVDCSQIACPLLTTGLLERYLDDIDG